MVPYFVEIYPRSTGHGKRPRLLLKLAARAFSSGVISNRVEETGFEGRVFPAALALRSSSSLRLRLSSSIIFFTTDRKSTRLNSSHVRISYAVFCLKKKKKNITSAQSIKFAFADLRGKLKLTIHLQIPAPQFASFATDVSTSNTSTPPACSNTTATA